MVGINIAKAIIWCSCVSDSSAIFLFSHLLNVEIAHLEFYFVITVSVHSGINVRSSNDQIYFSFSVLGGLTVSLVSLPVFNTSTESLFVSMSFALFKLTIVRSGQASDGVTRESKKNEIGKFSLLFVCSKAKGTLPEEVLIK